MSSPFELEDKSKGAASLAYERFSRRRLAVSSALILALLALLSAAAPLAEWMLGVSHQTVDLFNRFQPPSLAHPLGADELGRDVLARLLYGGRISLTAGLSAAFTAAMIGAAVGLPAGYHGGRLDAVLMRFTDGVISLPLLPLLIVLAAVDLEKLGVPASLANSDQASFWRIIVIVALVGWTTVARLTRGAALSLREREFVLAAKGMGASSFRIMTVHILPNLISPVIVATTLSVGNVILLESVLSFLGLGVQPPMPSWGTMLTNAQELIWSSPLLAIYPGVLILITVVSFNFLGDSLQDALDPRTGPRAAKRR